MKNLQKVIKNIIQTSIDLNQKMRAFFLKKSERFHYVFTLRILTSPFHQICLSLSPTANMLWSHLTCSNSNTSNASFESISSLIWGCNQNVALDKKGVVLFYLLHETLPSNLCEDIIANHLVNNMNDINSYQLNLSVDKLRSSTKINND